MDPSRPSTMKGTTSHAAIGLATLLPVVLFQQTISALCFPIAKYGLATFEPFTFAFYRFAISAIILVAIVKYREQGLPIERGDWWKIIGLGFIIIPINQTFYLWGQSLTGAGHAAVLFATTPVWVFVLAVIYLREKLLWRRVLGSAIALVGALTIVSSGAIRIGTEYLAGDLIVMVSVWAWSAYIVFGKPLAEKYGAIRVTAYALASGTVMYAPFGIYRAVQFDYSNTNLAGWLSVLYLALGVSVAAYTIYYWLLKQIPAVRLAVFSNIQPVIATAVAFFALGEIPGTAFFAGAVVVLTGVIITEV